MKKYLLLGILFIATIKLTPVFAQNIQTGNANANSTVINNIEGNGSVSTHIEVNANGETKTLDASAPGSYTLSVQSKNNQNFTPSVSPFPTSPKEEAPQQKKEVHKPTGVINLIANLTMSIENFIKRVFNYLKF